MWKSIFINQLMFLTHCRSGQCFRKRLETVRALSFILAASARTALNFMLGELLATGLGPQTRGNHWMTSKLTFGKVLSFLNHRNFFYPVFQNKLCSCILLEYIFTLKKTTIIYCSEAENIGLYI